MLNFVREPSWYCAEKFETDQRRDVPSKEAVREVDAGMYERFIDYFYEEDLCELDSPLCHYAG